MRKHIEETVSTALKKLYSIEKEILIDIPKDTADYSVNTALQCAKELGKSPKEIAKSLVEEINKNPKVLPFEKIEVAGPGFIYLTLSKQSLSEMVRNISSHKNNTDNYWGKSESMKSEKIMIEFACPNTHKAFHIGHLRNICLGESLIRIIESQGAEIFRSNYQGDIGMHVAKCLYGLKVEGLKFKVQTNKTPEEKAKFLGQVYAIGGTAYEEDEKAKKEIHEINKKLYEISACHSRTGQASTGSGGNPPSKTRNIQYSDDNQKLIEIYQETRNWSLEYFDVIYKRLGVHFDKFFFESETWKNGKEIVEKNIGKVFQESNGAIIFPGEDHGLHTRVFISSEGNPTYEAKDIGLAALQQKTFNFDTNIHIVANEQAEYFKVLFESMSQLWKGMKEKQKHLSYGMVKLTTGKMSSRTGDVITAEWLIDEAKEKICKILKDRDFSDKEREDVSEIIAIGAIKFMMLHTQAKNDIAFDLEKAVKLDGDSGPYIQYAHARICSILRKCKESTDKITMQSFNEADWSLIKNIQHFPYFVSRCAHDMSPHHLTHYLLKLVAEFSSWYSNNSVLNAETEKLKEGRILLLKSLQTTIKNGLDLLGIKAPEKM
ncbi:arginine--tRNA ligase [Candidatus Peregrinibacteria bacterium]|jgi:arginyl-tRNA synthetase|nr:arginine--tRNA ligase [Candidatus Peregrinibacteria bacterium]